MIDYKYKLVDENGTLWKTALTRKQALREVPAIEKKLNRKIFIIEKKVL